MIDIPWSIYRENLNLQNSDQWELILFDNESDLRSTNPNSLGERLLSYANIGSLGKSESISVIPQSRIKSISFPTPFPDFAVTPLPNKMNVYNSANYDQRDVSITFKEDVHFRGFLYFYNWFLRIYNPETKMFKADAETVYKYASIVFKKKGLYNLGIIDKPSMRFNLYKLKFKSFDRDISLDYENSNPVEFTAKMTVENVTFEPYN